jgi:hypothetical protein
MRYNHRPRSQAFHRFEDMSQYPPTCIWWNQNELFDHFDPEDSSHLPGFSIGRNGRSLIQQESNVI